MRMQWAAPTPRLHVRGRRGPPPPPKGWGQIFRLLPSPPQGRNACAYAYTTSYACICVHMLAHVCTCRHMYAYVCIRMH